MYKLDKTEQTFTKDNITFDVLCPYVREYTKQQNRTD